MSKIRARLIVLSFSICLFLINFLSDAQQIIVPPYLQPGNASTLTKEQKVLIWQTDSIPGKYKVEFALGSFGQKISVAKTTFVKLNLNNKTTFLYRAILTGLKFDCEYSYRVSLNEQSITEGSFGTRSKKQQTKFAVFGDCGAGTPQQAEIAYQVGFNNPKYFAKYFKAEFNVNPSVYQNQRKDGPDQDL